VVEKKIEEMGVDERTAQRMYLKATRVECVDWSPYAFLPVLEFLPCSIFVRRQSKEIRMQLRRLKGFTNILCKGDVTRYKCSEKIKLTY
jgi:hypothetical protein